MSIHSRQNEFFLTAWLQICTGSKNKTDKDNVVVGFFKKKIPNNVFYFDLIKKKCYILFWKQFIIFHHQDVTAESRNVIASAKNHLILTPEAKTVKHCFVFSLMGEIKQDKQGIA